MTPYLGQELHPSRRKGGPSQQRGQPKGKARVDDISKLLEAALKEPEAPARRPVDVEQEYATSRGIRQTRFEQDVNNLKLDKEMGMISEEDMRTKFAALTAVRDTDFQHIEAKKQEALRELEPAPEAGAGGAAKRRREPKEEEEEE